MARACPRVEVILHDVAVCARPRIVGEIRVALRVDERVRPDADENADEDARQQNCAITRHSPRLSYSSGAPLSLFLGEPHRQFTNQDDAGRETRPVPTERAECAVAKPPRLRRESAAAAPRPRSTRCLMLIFRSLWSIWRSARRAISSNCFRSITKCTPLANSNPMAFGSPWNRYSSRLWHARSTALCSR